jgi:hypothetical protein
VQFKNVLKEETPSKIRDRQSPNFVQRHISPAQWIFDVFESLLRAAGQAEILKSRVTGISSKVFDFDRPAGHNVSPRELYSHLQWNPD